MFPIVLSFLGAPVRRVSPTSPLAGNQLPDAPLAEGGEAFCIHQRRGYSCLDERFVVLSRSVTWCRAADVATREDSEGPPSRELREHFRSLGTRLELKLGGVHRHVMVDDLGEPQEGCSVCGRVLADPARDGRRIWKNSFLQLPVPDSGRLLPAGIPWVCQVCNGAVCKNCGAPLVFPCSRDILNPDGTITHCPIIPAAPRCRNPECPSYGPDRR